MTPLEVDAVGFAAPGLVGWPAGHACLSGALPYRAEPLPRLKPEGLPANERRRLSTTMRLALAVAEEALAGHPEAAGNVSTVFVSGNGDGDIIHAICEELSRAEPAVSPTQFHNSVHNAPAGYWSIASHAMTPHTAVAAHDASFAAGLLEAATMAGEGGPVLLVAYDRPLPYPLDRTRPGHGEFACALLLNGTGGRPLARLALELESGGRETVVTDPELESLRRGNPAARALPLFALLAGPGRGSVRLPYLDEMRLKVTLR